MGETVVLHLLLTTDTTSDRKKWWVAQGLELDLVAMGESPQEAQAAFIQTLEARVLLAKKLGLPSPFHGIKKAPEHLWRAFNKGIPLPNQPVPCLPDDFQGPVPTLEARVA